MRCSLPSRVLVLAGLCCNLVACATAPSTPKPLSAVLTGSNTVLLGEVHDNAVVHAFRLAALRQAVEAGWRPAIAMEQFDREKQATLDLVRQAKPVDIDRLIVEAAPSGKGWQWDYYRPVLALAIQYNLPIVAANLSRVDAAKVAKQGVAAVLPDKLIVDYGLAAGVPDDLLAKQRRAIDLGHCGQLPPSLLEGMAQAQIVRDVVMAEAIKPYLQNKRGVVLLAGNGHVRRDMGVPHWLPGAISVGMVEQTEAAAYDQTYLLPTQTRADPCAGLSLPMATSK
ncbi:ChaN family lipoprotein [Chitinimonas sp. BJB300]|uniref:ChaN family lipoprotein n=1 Tax=Chitinimonas sp. BJB300 TaxID=1559339 RepID=UPI0013043336|nr:ChaN family lipoprotein [Chitinimonas sp. BJB300]